MKNQHFSRSRQRIFAFKSKSTGLYLREDGERWTLNIELAELFLAANGKIALEVAADPRVTFADEVAPVEVIPKRNGTIKFNIQESKEAQE